MLFNQNLPEKSTLTVSNLSLPGQSSSNWPPAASTPDPEDRRSAPSPTLLTQPHSPWLLWLLYLSLVSQIRFFLLEASPKFAVELSTASVTAQSPFRPHRYVLNICLKVTSQLAILTVAPEAGISWDRPGPLALGPMGAEISKFQVWQSPNWRKKRE